MSKNTYFSPYYCHFQEVCRKSVIIHRTLWSGTADYELEWSAGCVDACVGLVDVRGRCGRSAPRAAKPQKADQCSGSSLRWVVFCRHFTGPRARTSNVPGSNTSSRREPSRQGGGRSCLCEYQGQTAGCSLPRKHQYLH